jgi:hypothetical protein
MGPFKVMYVNPADDPTSKSDEEITSLISAWKFPISRGSDVE